MFCPECDGVLKPKFTNGKSEKKALLYCLDCPYTSSDPKGLDEFVLKDIIEHDVNAWIEIIEMKDNNLSPEMREELNEQYRESLLNGN